MPTKAKPISAADPTTWPQLMLSGPVGPLADIEAKEGQPKLAGFSMVAYTGGPMQVMWWDEPVVIDLGGLDVTAKARPVLKDHNRSLVVGHTTAIDVNDAIHVKGVISGAGPVAREVLESGRNGFPWQVSVGAVATRVEFLTDDGETQVNGRTIVGPAYIVRAAVLKEVSFVALGADDNTSAAIAAASQGQEAHTDMAKQRMEMGANGVRPGTPSLSDQPERPVTAAEGTTTDNQPAPAPVNAAANPAPAPAAAPAVNAGVDVAAIARAEIEAERKRMAAIDALDAPETIKAKARAEGWTVERAELEALRAARPAAPAGIVRAGDVSMRALEAALCRSAGISAERIENDYDERTLEAADGFRDAGIHALFYAAIQASGGHVRAGQFNDDTIREAFRADRRAVEAHFSTVSLSGLLSNVANKALLDSFSAVETVVGEFCAEVDVKDFKQTSSYRLTMAGDFAEVGPAGELKHGQLTDESFTNQLRTYGQILSLTRQMIINDDLGAFLQLPQLLGRKAAIRREKAVFTLLLANTGSFFHTNNKNYFEGASTALQISSLTTAEAMFLDQVDSNGDPILVSPAILLVPTGLKVVAQQLMTETRVNEAASSAKPANNPHAGKWKPVASPFLNAQGLAGSSSSAWYLFANPRDIAAMEISYLSGRRTPTIESGETDFNTLGMQWRGFFDFGVAFQDPRAAVKAKGSA